MDRFLTTGSRLSRLIVLPQGLQGGQPVWRLHAKLLHHFAKQKRKIKTEYIFPPVSVFQKYWI